MKTDAFGARSSLETGSGRAAIYRLDALEKAGVAPGLDRLPFSIKVLLEAVLAQRGRRARHRGRRPEPGALERGRAEGRRDALHAGARGPAGLHRRARRGGPRRHARRPCSGSGATRSGSTRSCPCDLVIDHSVQVDVFGSPDALRSATSSSSSSATASATSSSRWGQKAFDNFRVVPPGDRHRPPGEPRVPGQGASLAASRAAASRSPIPDTLVGHRLAHDHDQRPGRGRAGASAASRPRRSCSASRSTC